MSYVGVTVTNTYTDRSDQNTVVLRMMVLEFIYCILIIKARQVIPALGSFAVVIHQRSRLWSNMQIGRVTLASRTCDSGFDCHQAFIFTCITNH